MDSLELRKKFLDFFEKNRHKIVSSSSLLPTDPSVFFTTAGMQQFKPYYLGEKSPWGPNVVSVQKCIRTSDIDEVGDESHLTFFEMLGNFSFGGYGKKDAIKYAYEFITQELNLHIEYVTTFGGDGIIGPDFESKEIWEELLKNENIPVRSYRDNEGRASNFWGPTGNEGPCGPTTEIYLKTSNGNSVEVWNIVFNEYYFSNGNYSKLNIIGIDTGMGLERLAMISQGVNNIFDTELFTSIIKRIDQSGIDIKIDVKDVRGKRIVADHIRAATFLISDGIKPSNTERGYILRRLLRRAIYYYHSFGFRHRNFDDLIEVIVDIYKNTEYGLDKNISKVKNIINEEQNLFLATLEAGKKKIEERIKIKNKILRLISRILSMKRKISGEDVFKLYSTYGYPLELIIQITEENLAKVDVDGFWREFKKHQELSKTASAGMFKGGLVDHKPETIKLHTTHHLLLAALQEVFGKQVKQKGSNINSERLRIDFSFDRKPTDEEKKKIEDIVNQKIKEGLDVVRKEMPKEEAEKIGAEMEFGVKYDNIVSVYFIEDKDGNVFSKEFCGGPHVNNTSELGKFKITKEEAVASGVRRIKAILE